MLVTTHPWAGAWRRVTRQAVCFRFRAVAPYKDVPELNNNRGNNRRRGRGNNRPQGGGQQVNRIDSRARGNAPQLLEKYRKLAQDAHLNGDRVQAEYYLQFADHYFRVIADTRQRQEEQRQRQHGGVGGDRWQDQDGEGEDGGEFGMDGDFSGFDRQPSQNNREPREYREPRESRPDRERNDRERSDRERSDREPRQDREPRREREPVEAGPVDFVPGVEGEPVSEAGGDNPFVRDSRPSRGLRPRSDRRPRRDEAEGESDAPAGLDPTSLPPSLGARAEPEPAEAAAPAPKKRGRPRKNPLPEAGEATEAVNG